MLDIEYNLSVFNENDFIEKNKLIHKSWVANNKKYNILKYNKEFLSFDQIETIGLFRSIIYTDNTINVFSPPKSININNFIDKYNSDDCFAEEYIEGTMINLFYDNKINKWEISTKSSVSANIHFFKDQPTFAKLFYEICNELNINFDLFSKDCCYSFVMQHPENKFVLQIYEKRLYLIACYKIDNLHVRVIPRHEISMQNNIYFPEQYVMTSYNELLNNYGTMNTSPNLLGVMIYHKDGNRTKISNPNYKYIKHLRGNNTKLQYQYLCLRKNGEIKDYLKFFPENKNKFNVFKKQVHIFTDTLYVNYINCYIKKTEPLINFPKQFSPHMYYLHQYYLSVREDRGYVNKNIVIQYINSLDSARLMYALNYHMRELSK